ncbi:transposase-like protein [Alkalibacillus flavidus]|uniref:Transposase-like protein n=1 Tax=Alkalibacillus flavidus TaxID=546021 RepID=A0ABV2KUU2_9BACI
MTQKGAFPNENALLKVLYLRIKELESKWKSGHIQNWSFVMNQLLVNEGLEERMQKYIY